MFPSNQTLARMFAIELTVTAAVAWGFVGLAPALVIAFGALFGRVTVAIAFGRWLTADDDDDDDGPPPGVPRGAW